MSRKLVYTFAKAQFSAFFGGIVDYIVMIGCTEFLHIHYTRSIMISGLVGALVNFSINRYWTYSGQKTAISNQLMKFYLSVLGSILLKSAGTWLITEGLGINYKFSRLFVDLVVSIGFNFMIQRFWVFKNKEVYTAEAEAA